MKISFLFVFIAILLAGCNKEPAPTENNDSDHITAAFRIGKIESLVKNLDRSLTLQYVYCTDADYRGYSKSWKFRYESVEPGSPTNKKVYLSSYFTYTKIDSSVIRRITFGNGAISKKWMDSDEAFSIAEDYGGRYFRSKYPDYKISASLSEGCMDMIPTWIIKYEIAKGNLEAFITIDACSGRVLYNSFY